MANLFGPQGRLYADPQPGRDEIKFREDNNSSQYYNSPYYAAHKSQVQAIPPRRNDLPLNLSDFVPQNVLDAIKAAGKIKFHAVGDTGAAKVNRSQTAPTAIENEARVADAMAADVQNQGLGGPAFFFHLGDVVYNFGEAQYYYDQFYEPFRAYDRPIFAIPGNHDGMVYGPTSTAPKITTLAAFQTNFCASKPGLSPDAGGLVRSVMTQPGVYFTLDAPFVSIIGLYSNVLDSGAGVISSQGGHFPIGDEQLNFLKSELARLKPQRQAGQRAVVLALHHPPLSADAKHGGSTGLQADLDGCCKAAGLWPDIVLSGHAHLYQRFTRNAAGKQTPYIVAGSGGFAATTPLPVGKVPLTVDDHTLEIQPIVDFGYLTVETDAKKISVTFQTADASGVKTRDSVTVDLTSGKLQSQTPAPGAQKGKGKPAKGKPGTTKKSKPAKTKSAKVKRTKTKPAARRKK